MSTIIQHRVPLILIGVDTYEPSEYRKGLVMFEGKKYPAKICEEEYFLAPNGSNANHVWFTLETVEDILTHAGATYEVDVNEEYVAYDHPTRGSGELLWDEDWGGYSFMLELGWVFTHCS